MALMRTRAGCYAGYKSRVAVPELVNEYMAGKTRLDQYITHEMKFDEV